MEEKHSVAHQINICERNKGSLSGVVDVISFDAEQILLETTQGMLTIKGKELHVSRLHLEQGEVDVEGQMDSIVYSENGPYGKKQKGSLVKRLFQ
jgi:sporulation protein YabP